MGIVNKKIIILTGGGTAGHITPLLAVAKELQKRDKNIELIYIGQKGDVNEAVIKNYEVPILVKNIYAGKYRRYPTHTQLQKIFSLKRHLLNIRDIVFTILGLFQSIYILLKLKPSAVFMKGGYVGVPVGLAAGLLRKKLITHDSDVIPGLANRIVGPFVSAHAVATNATYPYPKSKTFVTGIPIREEYYNYAEGDGKQRARAELGFKKDDLILFIGGSTQGAKFIDDCVEKVVPNLLNKYKNLIIVHVFGRLNEQTISDRYKDLTAEAKSRLQLHGFLQDNYKYMAASDILVGRAGATFIAEASVLSSACVIIPAAHLSGGHQVENAKILEKNKAVLLIEEKDLTEDKLFRSLDVLLGSKAERQALGRSLHGLERTDAAEAISKLILGD